MDIAEYVERAWGQALVAVSQAEEEASKLATKLAEVAGWGQDEVRRHARELSERLQRQRGELEGAVEEGVKKALTRLRVPRREELKKVATRLDRIAARLDALSRK